MIKKKFKKCLRYLWYGYLFTSYVVGIMVVDWFILMGGTLTLGKRSLVWEGVFHYSINPIIEWFWKV